MSEPLATVPEEIIDACEAVRAGELEAEEEQLVATFKVAPRGAQNHVLAALAAQRKEGAT